MAVAFGAIWLIEGQTGSQASKTPLAFDTVRTITGMPDAPKAAGQRRQIRIMTWNIDHGSDFERVASAMQDHPADLCLLQEVDWNTARAGEKDIAGELARMLRLNGSFAIEFEELSQERGHPAYIGQATLTDLPRINSYVLRFKRQSGFWKPHAWIPSKLPLMQRRLGNRIALVDELTFAGKPLVVYNAHLESRSAGPIQEHQIDEMLADCRRWPNDAIIILGGDLNTKYLPSIFLHKLQNAGFHSALGERIERSHRIAMTLDWLFVKGPARFTAGEVNRRINGSDHYPVYASLSAN